MTTYAKGADVEALARSARIIKGMQAELTRIEATSRGAMRSIETSWGGDNLRALVRHFNATAVPGLQACSGVFDAMARRLDENVATQRSASGLGGSGGSGSSGGTGGSGGAGGGGLNDVTKTEGKKFQLDPDKQPDSMGDESGTSYRHTTQDGRHSYENAKEGDDGRVRYDRYTHAGDYRDRQLEHESGWRSETERKVDRPWLPTDDSEDKHAFANRHPNADKAIDRGIEGVNWMERTDHEGHTDYEPVYYDADGNVTDKEHAVRMSYGGGMGTEAKGYHEFGIKEGALAAGLGGTAGAYLLRGGVEGNLGNHGTYNASGFVGAEGKADASVALGKDGLVAKADASVMAGVKGEAGVAYDNGPLAAHASANAMAGVEAKADASRRDRQGWDPDQRRRRGLRRGEGRRRGRGQHRRSGRHGRRRGLRRDRSARQHRRQLQCRERQGQGRCRSGDRHRRRGQLRCRRQPEGVPRGHRSGRRR